MISFPQLTQSDQVFAPELADVMSSDRLGFQGDFGDFCLMCGEMIQNVSAAGDTLDNAYCSQDCEMRDQVSSASSLWWGHPRVETSQCHSLIDPGSTRTSSAATSPPDSPSPSVSDRLAILCSGPPPCESLPSIDLGERLLGAAAVARYLKQRTLPMELLVGEDDQDDAWASVLKVPQPAKPLGPPTLSLKATPATAALSDPTSLAGLPDQVLSRHPIHHRPVFMASILPRRTASFNDRRTPFIHAVHPARRVSQPLPISFTKSRAQSSKKNPVPGFTTYTPSNNSIIGPANEKPVRLSLVRSPSSPQIWTPVPSSPLLDARQTHESYAFYL